MTTPFEQGQADAANIIAAAFLNKRIVVIGHGSPDGIEFDAIVDWPGLERDYDNTIASFEAGTGRV